MRDKQAESERKKENKREKRCGAFEDILGFLWVECGLALPVCVCVFMENSLLSCKGSVIIEEPQERHGKRQREREISSSL